MLQFGELLTLGFCAVTVIYLVLHRRQIGAVAVLRPLLVPFVLVTVAFLATVVEGLPAGGDVARIIFWERSPEAVQRAGWLGGLLNLIEHLSYLGAAISLAAIVWKRRKAPAGSRP